MASVLEQGKRHLLGLWGKTRVGSIWRVSKCLCQVFPLSVPKICHIGRDPAFLLRLRRRHDEGNPELDHSHQHSVH